MVEESSQPLLQDEEGYAKPQNGIGAKVKGMFATIFQKENIPIIIYTLCYIVSGVINSILLKLTMNSFQNYGFFLNQLTNYGYIPIFGAVVAYKLYFTNDIPEETKLFPKYKFLIMGALDAVTGYFVVIGGVRTSGPLQQLLNQAIIPFTMLASLIFLKERYSLIQVGGAAVILSGVVVSLIPSLTGPPDPTNSVFWNFFYLISIIPFAGSNVYKDIGFQAVADMDVWYLQFWDAFFQSIIGTFLFPINAILPGDAKIPFNQVLPAMKNGALCLAGHDIIVDNCGTDLQTTCDNCHHAYIIILCYMTINVIYNIFILLVIKHAGATVYSIANTLRLPLTNIVFSLHFIMGAAVTPFSGLSVAGLIIILLGLVGYRIGSMIKAKKAALENGGEVQVRVIPGLGPAGVDVMPVHRKTPIEPKSPQYLRNQLYGKLGIHVPENKYNRPVND
ncbi:putative transmembrane protein [Cavenderia fasciculata]|uniref:Transmembrane protein n=1 Tax=Cavenderia fasciculata TaxID=261658 RepID=F4Q0G1_CACFS|nr:putative transmembrane protein [Cavenderia fasciculata]EGG18312.1 putative transmembrane protein [Cavenderia fasciculata]|eukprot:XP_004357135.1 putative transmembrane protein [Cavenderia fasciculata]